MNEGIPYSTSAKQPFEQRVAGGYGAFLRYSRLIVHCSPFEMSFSASTTWRPQREVEIVAGTPPGGGLDRLARALVKALESKRLLDVPAKATNIAGDGGRRAWAYLDRHPGDAHVLSISSANLTTDHLLGNSTFDHEAAFTPLAILYTEYIAFVASGDSEIESGAEICEIHSGYTLAMINCSKTGAPRPSARPAK